MIPAGAVASFARTIAPYALLAFAWVAVAWQTLHIIEWAADVSAACGDGSVASFLRVHAYTYMERVFGDTFGWRLGGVE